MQEYWSGLLFPPPGDLFNPGIEPGSPTLQVDSLSYKPPGKPHIKPQPSAKQKAKENLYYLRQKHLMSMDRGPVCLPTQPHSLHGPQGNLILTRASQRPGEEQAGWGALGPRNNCVIC